MSSERSTKAQPTQTPSWWSDHFMWLLPLGALAVFSLVADYVDRPLTDAERRESLLAEPTIGPNVQAARECFGFEGIEAYNCAEQAAARRCGVDGYVYEGERLLVSRDADKDAVVTTNFYSFRCKSDPAA